MDIRKSFDNLSANEIENFIEALVKLKAEIVNPNAPSSEQYSTYDQFVALHLAVMRLSISGSAPINFGHNNIAFLPWHREFIRRFELALQRVKPGVTLPYWDWSKIIETNNLLFTDDFLGPLRQNSGIVMPISSGYFAYDAPVPRPIWWPNGFNGWRIPQGIRTFNSGTTTAPVFPDRIYRVADITPFSGLIWPPTATDISNTIAIDLNIPAINDYYFLWLAVEQGQFYRINAAGTALESVDIRMHNTGHNWIGGHMATGGSPNEPAFWLHHSFVDYLWAAWQDNGHAAESDYPNAINGPGGIVNPPGSLLNDEMWPWVGNAPGYQPDVSQRVVDMLPDYTNETPVVLKEVLDFRSMGYSYDNLEVTS